MPSDSTSAPIPDGRRAIDGVDHIGDGKGGWTHVFMLLRLDIEDGC